MIEVWDKGGRFTKDKLIGRARVMLKDLYRGETNEKVITLMGVNHGEIKVALLAVDFGLERMQQMQPQPSYQQRRYTSTENYYPAFIPHNYDISQATRLDVAH
jgi:hypothetical protein